MTVKDYFKERTVSQMKQGSIVRFQTKRNLDDRIEDLAPEETGVIAVRLIPGEFMRHAKTEEEGARAWQKKGQYYAISQPKNETEARHQTTIPLTARQMAIQQIQRNVRLHPENSQIIGLSFHGITTEDGRKRNVGLVKVGRAHRILSYAANINKPIINHIYSMPRVEEAGAIFLCSVPSRRKGIPDYHVKFENVPFFNGTDKRVLAWSMQSSYTSNPPMSSLADMNLSADLTHPIYSSPQEIAAYMAIIEDQLAKHNFTPLEMNVYPLFSRSQSDFARKLSSQVLVQDVSIKGKLRKLYEAEQSWLLMQRAINKGHDETLYWDPSRDGKLSSY
ncbi:MAG TPA: hypothetical protein VHA12_01800 [Candidatus Nanoarchaeia archaeon]|nr:hypothetical protein [Candidatus Nanoarchaeia archaeon]